MSGGGPLVMLVRSLHVGGLEKMVIELCRQLLARDVPVQIWCVEERGALASGAESMGITVRSLEKGLGLSPRAVFKLRGWLKKADVSLVHSHNPLAHFYAAMAVATLSGVKLIHTSHQMWMPQSWRQLAYSRASARFTDLTIGVSEAVRESATREIQVPDGASASILNGIDLTPYLSLDPPGPAIGEAPLIGTVGRLHPVKNHALLIDALSRLRPRHPRLSLRIVGEGEMRPALESQARSLGLSESVQLPGVRDDVNRQLADMDVFVMSSHFEGMPLVLVEAMAAARPIVATDVGGIGEMVGHEKHGLLVPPDDPAAMAEALERILSDRSLAISLATAARQRAASRYDSTVMTEAYLDRYKELVGDVAH